MSTVYGYVCGKGNKDPLRQGRIQVIPFDMASIDPETAPWCSIQTSTPKSYRSSHVGIQVGEMVQLEKQSDGSYSIVDFILTNEDPAPPGSVKQIVPGQSKFSGYSSTLSDN